MRDQDFVEYLQGLATRNDRAALATLRRGIMPSSKYRIGMYRYVARWVGSHERDWSEECLYLLAALFAHYPEATSISGNFGESVRLLRNEKKSDSVERRFIALLGADARGLPTHLRYMTSLLAAHGIAMNWFALLRDIQRWKHPARYVERAWARQFWRELPDSKSAAGQTGKEKQEA